MRWAGSHTSSRSSRTSGKVSRQQGIRYLAEKIIDGMVMGHALVPLVRSQYLFGLHWTLQYSAILSQYMLYRGVTMASAKIATKVDP